MIHIISNVIFFLPWLPHIRVIIVGIFAYASEHKGRSEHNQVVLLIYFYYNSGAWVTKHFKTWFYIMKLWYSAFSDKKCPNFKRNFTRISKTHFCNCLLTTKKRLWWKCKRKFVDVAWVVVNSCCSPNKGGRIDMLTEWKCAQNSFASFQTILFLSTWPDVHLLWCIGKVSMEEELALWIVLFEIKEAIYYGNIHYAKLWFFKTYCYFFNGLLVLNIGCDSIMLYFSFSN